MQDSMSVGRILWPLIALGATGVFFAQLTSTSGLQQDDLPLVVDELFYVKPQISVAQLLEARGYRAQEFFFTSKDGYKLCITRGTNPLINNGERGLDHKLPMFFVHGTVIPSTSFILNSAGVRPRVFDTRGVNMHKMTTERLAKMVKGDPSAKSLPFLAMNFGYEVWILDRRGILRSRGKLGHENRTLVDALKSLPTSLLGNAIDAGFKVDHQASSVGRTRRLMNESDSEPLANKPRAANSETSSGQAKRVGLLQALFTFTKLMKRDWRTSEDKIKLFIETFDPGYWSYSLDEQAEFDFPQAIDLILHKTGRKQLNVLGMSAGGTISLLALAAKPELADKISKMVLWASPTSVGEKTFGSIVGRLLPLIRGFVGPLPFPFTLPALDAILSLLCSSEIAMEALCEPATDIIAGFSSNQAPMRLFFASSLFRPVSILEVTQLYQFKRPDGPCKLQLNTRAGNIKRYGQARAPCYDLGRIKLRNIKFYVGGTDFLVSPGSVRTTISKLKVPTELRVINETGVFFNHIGYFLHKRADRLVILPTLLDFERSMSEEPDDISSE